MAYSLSQIHIWTYKNELKLYPVLAPTLGIKSKSLILFVQTVPFLLPLLPEASVLRLPLRYQ